MKKKNRNFFDLARKSLGKEKFEEAVAKGEAEILKLRLSQLREKVGKKTPGKKSG